MASPRKTPEAGQTEKTEKKSLPKRGIKNPFIYVGTIIILVITVIAFVFIPSIGGLGSSGTSLSFGTWNGKDIKYESGSYFATQVAQINNYLRQQGMSEENFQLYAYQVWNMAFQSTAVRAAILETVKSSGFKVTEAGVDAAIATNESFMENGVFSLEKYNSLPKSQQLSLRESTREDLYIRRFYEDIYGTSPSTSEMEFVSSMIKPQRSIAYLSFPLDQYPEENLAAWGKENADLFRTLGISRITLTSSEADAKKVLQQVTENKLSFEDAAKSHSQDAYADLGGDAGKIFYYSFAESFENTSDAEEVAALGKGELSKVYKIADKAWAFFRINEAISAPDFNAETTLDEAEAYLFDKERGTLESWAMAKANQFIAAASTGDFTATAKKARLEVKEAGPFILNLGNPSFYAYNQQIPLFQTPFAVQDYILQSAETDEAFMTELFTLKAGQISRPLILGDAILVFKVTDDTEATDDESAMIKFMYPYFYQETLDGNARTTFLKSPKFKDEFNDTFFKVFQTSSQGSSESEAAPAAEETTEQATTQTSN